MGRHGTLDAGLSEIVDSLSGQQLKDTVDILVIHHAEHDAQGVTRLLSELFDNVLDSSHIMPGVADECRMLAETLPASHESGQFADVSKSLPHIGFRELDATFMQDRQGGQEGVGVLLLTESAELSL